MKHNGAMLLMRAGRRQQRERLPRLMHSDSSKGQGTHGRNVESLAAGRSIRRDRTPQTVANDAVNMVMWLLISMITTCPSWSRKAIHELWQGHHEEVWRTNQFTQTWMRNPTSLYLGQGLQTRSIYSAKLHSITPIYL